MENRVGKKHEEFLKELQQLYSSFDGKACEAVSYNDEFTNAALSLLDKQPVEVRDLREYCGMHQAEVGKAVRKVARLDYRQPAVLLLFYYIEYYDRFLAYNWPFSIELFRKFRSCLGLASSSYM
jgi:hypothetical protein